MPEKTSLKSPVNHFNGTVVLYIHYRLVSQVSCEVQRSYAGPQEEIFRLCRAHCFALCSVCPRRDYSFMNDSGSQLVVSKQEGGAAKATGQSLGKPSGPAGPHWSKGQVNSSD